MPSMRASRRVPAVVVPSYSAAWRFGGSVVRWRGDPERQKNALEKKAAVMTTNATTATMAATFWPRSSLGSSNVRPGNLVARNTRSQLSSSRPRSAKSSTKTIMRFLD